ncbi:ribonuclease H-like domain-containing protein [Tanacetum coccineum]
MISYKKGSTVEVIVNGDASAIASASASNKENTSSTNEAVNTAHDVSIASSQGQASSSTYADDVMFSFFANQSNSPQLDNEDLEQIDTDDLEEMDLKWQVAMLTMRVKRFLKKTGRNLNFNGKETIGFDKTKVECYNCHRRAHFARECMLPRNQWNRNGDGPKRNAPVDTSTTNALVVQDGILCRESDVDDSPVNDRFKIGEGFHAVPPPYTGNYMPSRPDLSFAGLDDYVYKTKDTDSDNDSVFRPKSEQTKPKFTKINFVKSDKNVKFVNKENTHKQVEYPRKSQSPRGNRRNWNGMMTQKLGNGFEFIKKACFVCGSFNHLIKDYDFHDKKMVEKQMLNNKGKVTGQREIRPIGSLILDLLTTPIIYSAPHLLFSISTKRNSTTKGYATMLMNAGKKTNEELANEVKEMVKSRKEDLQISDDQNCARFQAALDNFSSLHPKD